MRSSRWNMPSRGRSSGDARRCLPEQSLTLQDMVDAYTINAAFALKQERTTGSLEAGKRGDFIVLDRDIFSIDPFDLHRHESDGDLPGRARGVRSEIMRSFRDTL